MTSQQYQFVPVFSKKKKKKKTRTFRGKKLKLLRGLNNSFLPRDK